jgi:cytochrome c biogenesis protein CcmG/thiol:disulfide interchange protein DsbE
VVVLGVAVLGIVSLVAAVGSPRPPREGPLLAPRTSVAPGFILPALSIGRPSGAAAAVWQRAIADGSVSFKELAGVPMVVNFWASWCDPCRREAPVLERAWTRADGNVLVVGVDQNDAREDATRFLRRFSVSYPVVREAGDKTAIRWGVGGFPATFFVAADGRVVAEAIGELHPDQLRRGIAAARRGSL